MSGTRYAQRALAEQEARQEREARGTAVVSVLARLGVPATYEDRQFALVSLSLEDAESLVAAVNAVDAAWPGWLGQRIRRYTEIAKEGT